MLWKWQGRVMGEDLAILVLNDKGKEAYQPHREQQHVQR